jgi:hypothetical protein
MAITYVYPTAIPELQDLLIGTETAVQGGENAPRTRTFTIGSIVDLVEATLPPYITQVNSDWNATSGFAEILNKPIIPTTPGLQQVIDVGTRADKSGQDYIKILEGDEGARNTAFGVFNSTLANSNLSLDPYVAVIEQSYQNNQASMVLDYGFASLRQRNIAIAKTTNLEFGSPTVNTTVKVPAKSVAGTYTLATLDDIPTRPYKVYTALLTQNGDSNLVIYTAGTLEIGKTYEIYDLTGAASFDFTNVGAPNNNIGTYFVATGTIPNSWGINVGLKANTGAPVATVLENTIGNIWFEYNQGGGPVGSNGEYFAKSSNLFTPNKTITFGDTSFFSGQSYWINYRIDYNNDVYITTGSGSGVNNLLLNTPIEIRVYN